MKNNLNEKITCTASPASSSLSPRNTISESSRVNSSQAEIPNSFPKSVNSKPESKNEEIPENSSNSIETKPVLNFKLDQKCCFQIQTSCLFKSNSGIIPKPFTVDSVDTFIDADSIIDYGSLATTQPIDVDEALGALDSLKFIRNEDKLSDPSSVWAKNEKFSKSSFSISKLNEYKANKDREVNLWQLRSKFDLKGQNCSKNEDDDSQKIENTKNKIKSDDNVEENPICPTILPKLPSKKNSSVNIFYEFSQKIDDTDKTSQVELEIVKGCNESVKCSNESDAASRFDGEWGSGWTSPLTAGTSSDGNLDEEEQFKGGDSEEDDITWKAEDQRLI